jgi:hypothetical protein
VGSPLPVPYIEASSADVDGGGREDGEGGRGIGRVFILRCPGTALLLLLGRGGCPMIVLLRPLLMPKLMLCPRVLLLALCDVPLPLLPIPTQALMVVVVVVVLLLLLLLLLAVVSCFFFPSFTSSLMLLGAEEEESDRKARRLLGLPSCRRWKMLGVVRAGGSCCGFEGSKGLLAVLSLPLPLSESFDNNVWITWVNNERERRKRGVLTEKGGHKHLPFYSCLASSLPNGPSLEAMAASVPVAQILQVHPVTP